MTLKKFSRAGLVALAGAVLLAIVLSLPTFHGSYAQTSTTTAPATPAAAAPAAAEAAPPACDAKTLEKCTPNSGDTAWMLTSMAIVLMMTIPGLALFYGGMVRKKNVGDTVMTSFAITCLVSILWLFSPTAWRSAAARRSSAGSIAPSCKASSATSRRASAIPTRWRRRSPRPSTRCSS